MTGVKELKYRHYCVHKFRKSFVMAVDWIGFGYAAAIAFGGFMGYNRRGSVMSLMAGLVFGVLAAYGAYNVSYDPKDIKVSLRKCVEAR
ncbi:Transmembrane protein 14C [Liparis tanakae]|uniref:Transmembrane protein 14C n=1 Tax=Liparis tanakae TaxID=230148 RepID=A0A4Z2GRZ9_9TELE|nr:Transmembrane protein 14C [Liparis tanakae]